MICCKCSVKTDKYQELAGLSFKIKGIAPLLLRLTQITNEVC